MFTEPMIRLFAIVLNRDAEKVTEALLMSGAVQFITSHSFPADSAVSFLQGGSVSNDASARIAEARRRIEVFLSSVNIEPDIPPGIDTASSPPAEVGAINLRLDALAFEQQKIRERQRLLQNDILKYEEMQRQVTLYGAEFSAATLQAHYSYVSMQLGSVLTDALPSLQEQLQVMPAVVIPVGETGKRSHTIVIAMKRDRERIHSLLAGSSWQPVELTSDLQGAQSDITTAIEEKLAVLRNEQAKLQQTGREVITGKKEELTGLWTLLRIDELRLKIRSAFKQSSHTVFFSGWVPASRKTAVTSLLEQTTVNHCHIEWFTPEQTSDLKEKIQDAPVKFNNPKLFAPFQMLVANFGIPEYGSIDPTPFVVVTYLVMFGLMFADIGQGAVVAAGGIAGTLFFNKRKNALRNLSALLLWCGGSSMLFGALFGSLFGFSVMRPIWFDFHGIVSGHVHPSSGISSIYDILGITVKFGIGVIGCGLCFNWINLIIKRRWSELLIDKGGITGGWIYAGGIYCAWYMMSHGYKSLPGSSVLFWSLALPALLLFFKAPLHARKHRTPVTPGILLNFVMEWIVELLEVFGGYLSNTLSFMRVAGLGIAHVSLMGAFFTIADMVRGDTPGIAASLMAVLLIVAGNILVIALEGLSAGIQALRLNYYEFFTKFFHGTGRLYEPVSLGEYHH